MKILIFDGSFKTTPFINNLVKGLREDNKVFIFGFNEKLSKPIKNISYIPLGSNDSKLRFIIVSLLYSLRGGYLFKCLQYLIKGDRIRIQKLNLDHQLRVIKPDIIHLQWLSNIVWFESYLKDSSMRFILSFRGYHINVRPYVQLENRKYLENWLPYFNGIHGVSMAILGNLEKLKINLTDTVTKSIYSGHELSRLSETKTSWKLGSPISLLLVGRNHWIKNYSLVISLAKKIRDNNMPIKFRFVGLELNDSEEILFLTKLYDLENYLEFIPNQSPDKLKDIYRQADALILPSLEEGIANVCIEAMSYRLPVIASDVGGMSELIESEFSGVLVKDISVDGFYNALQLFSRMSEKDIENMVNNGYETVKTKFSSEKMIKDFNRFYKIVLDA